jgi:hypothetical protein
MLYQISCYESVGPIKFGMTKGAVEEILGEPQSTSTDGNGRSTYYYSHLIVRFAEDSSGVDEVSFIEDGGVELECDGIRLAWDGSFILEMCALDKDARESCGFIILPRFGLLLADFFDADAEPAISVENRDGLESLMGSPLLNRKQLQKAAKKFGAI